MAQKRSMLTTPGGPVVISARTLRALVAIRRDKLLPQLYPVPLLISRANFESLSEVLPEPPSWLVVADDAPDQKLPARVDGGAALDRQTLQLALANGASLVLIDGPIKERAKLSFFKCEGTVSILVMAHRAGLLTAVAPMVKALDKLGFADVLPPPESLTALWKALDALGDE